MAYATRSSKRVKKLRRDNEFAYDEATLNFLTERNNSEGDVWHHRMTYGSTSADCIQPNSESFAGNNVINTWSTLNLLPPMIQQSSSSVNNIGGEVIDIAVDVRSHGQLQNKSTQTARVTADRSQYSEGARPRNNVRDFRGYSTTSSTRLDFIGPPFIDPSFLCMSPTVHSDSSEVYVEEVLNKMDNNNKCQQCAEGITCEVCKARENDRDLRSQLTGALGKIRLLEEHMSRQNVTIMQQSDRLHSLETSRSESSGGESRGASSATNGKQKKSKGVDAAKVTKKLVRIEEEGERQFKVVTEQLRCRDQLSFNLDESSEEELTMKDIRKKMSKKERERCNNKVSSRMKQAGATYPMADFETSNSSGTEYSEVESKFRVRSRRSKVKSGAKVKTRPVIRTELWPHTIANEEDGEDVTSEDISLAKFLSCFTCIMSSCGREESAGRARLLNAVSSVLECLPWAEARLFHNMVMVKVEQGRFEWTSDFLAMGDQFVDKKVRQNLRSKNLSGGTGFNSKGPGKGSRNGRSYSNPSNNYSNPSSNFQNRSRSSQPGVCRNWNFGTCTFAERCNRLHVCCTCADAGKPGEQHKASTHENSRGSERNYRPRV